MYLHRFKAQDNGIVDHIERANSCIKKVGKKWTSGKRRDIR